MTEKDIPPLSSAEAAALRAVGVEPYPIRSGTTSIARQEASLAASADLPGFDRVLRALRPELSEAHIVAFFQTPQSDLEDEQGCAMNPTEWLRAGHAVESVVNLARSL